MIIALDGPAAAGKGTLAKRLSAHYSLPHLDTGLLYRAVGMLAHEADITEEAAIAAIATKLSRSDLARDDLRTAEAGDYASRVAVLKSVREQLLTFQRDFANQKGGAVLDGRDIATVIAPHADVKLFVTASAEARATRRHLELPHLAYESILADIRARDERDASRSTAPLMKADDAHQLDTSNLSADAAFQAAIAVIARKISAISSSRDKR